MKKRLLLVSLFLYASITSFFTSSRAAANPDPFKEQHNGRVMGNKGVMKKPIPCHNGNGISAIENKERDWSIRQPKFNLINEDIENNFLKSCSSDKLSPPPDDDNTTVSRQGRIHYFFRDTNGKKYEWDSGISAIKMKFDHMI